MSDSKSIEEPNGLKGLHPILDQFIDAGATMSSQSDQELAKRVVPTSGEMHEILMNYGKVCEEQGCLSPKAVTIRMDLATHFNDMEASLTNQTNKGEE